MDSSLTIALLASAAGVTPRTVRYYVSLGLIPLGSPFLGQHLDAAWFRPTAGEDPMIPRLVGPPGLGKTTLAYVVGRELGRSVYIFQCTMETRPEDFLVTPVISGKGKVEYRASSLLSAVIKGGIAILDEGKKDDPLTTRDGISIARFAGRLIKKGVKTEEAIKTALDAVADEKSGRRA